jgi:hypothetical protein
MTRDTALRQRNREHLAAMRSAKALLSTAYAHVNSRSRRKASGCLRFHESME